MDNENLRDWFMANSQFYVLSAIAQHLRIHSNLFIGWVMGDPKKIDMDTLWSIEQWAKQHGYGLAAEPIQVLHTVHEQYLKDPDFIGHVKERMAERIGKELLKRGDLKFSEPKPEPSDLGRGLFGGDPFRKYNITTSLIYSKP